MFRPLAAAFDEKIVFVPKSTGITFCQIGGGPVPRAEESDGLFTTFAHGVFADPSAEHFSNSGSSRCPTKEDERASGRSFIALGSALYEKKRFPLTLSHGSCTQMSSPLTFLFSILKCKMRWQSSPYSRTSFQQKKNRQGSAP